MGKSIRSKVKRKFRAIKREIITPEVDAKTIKALATMSDQCRPKGIEYAPREVPADPRVRCQAYRLAFPEETAASEDHKAALDADFKTTNFAAPPQTKDMDDSEEEDRIAQTEARIANKLIAKKSAKSKRRKGRDKGAKGFW